MFKQFYKVHLVHRPMIMGAHYTIALVHRKNKKSRNLFLILEFCSLISYRRKNLMESIVTRQG